LHFDCGLEWAEGYKVQSYSPGGANVPLWKDTLPNPKSNPNKNPNPNCSSNPVLTVQQ